MTSASAASPPRLVALGNSHLDALRFAVPVETSVEKFGFAVDYLSEMRPDDQPMFRQGGIDWAPNDHLLADLQDLRDVTGAGVEHVMRLFMRHYAGDATAQPAPVSDEAERYRQAVSAVERDARVLCDEAALARDRLGD